MERRLLLPPGLAWTRQWWATVKVAPPLEVFELLGGLDGAAAFIAAGACVDEVVVGGSKGRPSVGGF